MNHVTVPVTLESEFVGSTCQLWCAYYSDLSGFAIFTNELDCLRYAVEHGMHAKAVLPGDLREQLR